MRGSAEPPQYEHRLTLGRSPLEPPLRNRQHAGERVVKQITLPLLCDSDALLLRVVACRAMPRSWTLPFQLESKQSEHIDGLQTSNASSPHLCRLSWLPNRGCWFRPATSRHPLPKHLLQETRHTSTNTQLYGLRHGGFDNIAAVSRSHAFRGRYLTRDDPPAATFLPPLTPAMPLLH